MKTTFFNGKRLCLSLCRFALLLFFLSPASAENITNVDVLKLHAAGLDESVIIDKIRTSEPKFDTSVAALLELKDAGIPQSVILEIIQASGPDKGGKDDVGEDAEFVFKEIFGRNWLVRYNMIQGEYANVMFDWRGVRWVHTKGNLRGEDTDLPWRHVARICFAPHSLLPSIKIFTSTGNKYRLNPSTWDGDPEGRAREVMSYLLRAKENGELSQTVVNLECKD